MNRFLSVLLTLSILLYPTSAQPKGYIALTFDDGPSGAITDRLLEGLAERDVKATFFLCCYRMEQYPDTLNRIVRGGHEIGLHSCCHQFMHKMSKAEVQADLEAGVTVLAEYGGVGTNLFRPPGGLYNDALLEVSEEMGFSVVLWSVDPNDWKPGNGANVLPYLLKHAGDGDLVLLHDLYDSSVDAALALIDRLRAEGYEFCTVSELAACRGTELKPGEIYRSFARDAGVSNTEYNKKRLLLSTCSKRF